MKTHYPLLVFSLVLLATSADAQNYWQPTVGLAGRSVRSIAVGSNYSFAATLDSGIYRSIDGGQSWVQANTGITDLRTWSVVIDPNSTAIAYVGTQASGVYRTTDYGGSWTQTAFNRHWVISITINDAGHIFIATADTGIHRSTDDGNTWQRVGDPFEIGSDVYTLAINSLGHIFAGTDARIFRSTDNGLSWIRSDSGVVVTGVIWSLAMNSAGDVFAGDGGGFFVGPGSVYRSSNNGNYWTQTPMTKRSVLSLAINSSGHIFAGTDSGVVISTNNGNSGTRINSGLTVLRVYSIAIDSAGYAFAGTAGGGIFRSAQPTTLVRHSGNGVPTSYMLHQNYPNPFNPSTIISYDIPKRSHVKLVIYDILGRQVEELVDSEKTPGRYQATFDASGLPSGVYYYRLEAGSFTETKKLILLR